MQQFRKFLAGISLVFLGLFAGEVLPAQDTVLNNYIRIGLENNITLRRKYDSLDISLAALKASRGLFYPDISFNARYSVAEGGRMIDFPVGDLLNPVYQTLNQLTQSQQFPTVSNMQFPFLRPTEQETKLRLVQPLVNTDIIYNAKIRQSYTGVVRADAGTYRRELVAQIKTAYYTYLKTLRLEEVLKSTAGILRENIRVNQSLYDNEKVTLDVVLRSEAELSDLQQRQAEAEKSRHTAAAWFNFLLNRDLSATIVVEEPRTVVVPVAIDQASEDALARREELVKIDGYTAMAGNNLRLRKSTRIPDLTAVIDYGFQGEDYSFTANDDYVMASLVLKWDIFKGLQNKRKISEAKIQYQLLEDQRQEAENMIRLEVINAWYALLASKKKIDAARAREDAAVRGFRLVDRKYKQGQSNLLEYMDARNNMTRAETGLVMARYDYFISYAGFERAAGLYSFSNETK
ncbi:MAG TPA: TolC family protein [Bacteroidales bacterium]|nr:TolC family protein [Bacteroidales bacterium]